MVNKPKAGPEISSAGLGSTQGAMRDVGVSRISVGFRHLMDWTASIGMNKYIENNLRMYQAYDIKGTDAGRIPGGGFPRAEFALYAGLNELKGGGGSKEHVPSDLFSGTGYGSGKKELQQGAALSTHTQQLEYLVATGEVPGSRARPDVPTRRWLYGIPDFYTNQWHSAGDAKQPHLEKELKDDTGGIWHSELSGNLWHRFGRHFNKFSEHTLEQLGKFIESGDAAGAAMGYSMIKGHLRDLIPAEERGEFETEQGFTPAEAKVLREMEKLGGHGAIKSGKSKQEMLVEMTESGYVVITDHTKLGGSEAFDVLFHEPLKIEYDGPNSPIEMKLVDLTEVDWSKGYKGGRGKKSPKKAGGGKYDLETAGGITEYYNKDRIPHFNNIINFVRKFVDTASGTPPSGDRGTDQTTDAWYRRRATQIASDIKSPLPKGTKRTGTSAGARGKSDDLTLVLNDMLESKAIEDAWVAEMFSGIDAVLKEDISHVLHHMGSANALYEDARREDFIVDEYGQMFSYGGGTVAINFKVNEDGEIEDLKEGDVAVIEKGLNDILLSVWTKSKTEGGLGFSELQILEARQLFETAAGMSNFRGYFIEEVGSAMSEYGTGQKFQARVDSAVPLKMDLLMQTLFLAGSVALKEEIKGLKNDMKGVSERYSETLRGKLIGNLGANWPTDSWGSRHQKYSGGQSNTPASDFIHSDTWSPPTALSHQFKHGLDFKVGGQPKKGAAAQFIPQVGDAQWMGTQETDEQFFNRVGYLPSATPEERAAAQNIPYRDAQGRPNQIPSQKRTRHPAVMGQTDFEAAARQEADVGGGGRSRSRMWWYYSASGYQRGSSIWRPNENLSEPSPVSRSDLGFVWAAPYLVYQHYQKSGSKDY